MSPIRLDDFEANLRFQVALIEVSEGHHKTLKTETDFRFLRFVNQIDTNSLKMTQTVKSASCLIEQGRPS